MVQSSSLSPRCSFHTSCWGISFFGDGDICPQELFISLHESSVLFCSYIKHRHCACWHQAQQHRMLEQEECTQTGSAPTLQNNHPSAGLKPDLQGQAMRSEISKGHTGKATRSFTNKWPFLIFHMYKTKIFLFCFYFLLMNNISSSCFVQYCSFKLLHAHTHQIHT